MRTVVVGTRPPELDALIADRTAKGLDMFDEVWKGEFHMNPAPHARHARLDDELAALLRPYAQRRGLTGLGPFNLGAADDYRVPDRGFTVTPPDGVFVATAEVVVEIVSPGDETFEKLPFYASLGVRNVIVVDPAERRVRIFAGLAEVAMADALDLEAAELASAITWP
jgi:Uma2 family endonuclease